MTINFQAPELRELKPRIMVCGVGGAGCNAVNNMIVSGLTGVDFIVANTDAQALTTSKAERIIQMGLQVTEGLGAGAQPEVGRAAAEEALEEIRDHLMGAHMCFVTAGMGGGTGTGAAPVIARIAREMGILTVGVVTKPFHFEGARRMRLAEAGITELTKAVDTLIVIPNQNLFRIANEKTTFADAFAMADQVLYSGVASITDLMVKQGLVNLDFADVRSIMREMGKAMMGTGEASGDNRAILAAEAAIANPLLDEVSMKGARRMRLAEAGITELTKAVDTLIVIPNQNLFRIANEKTTFADAFAMADQVLYSGVASITDLMVKQGLVNLDFADVRSIMREMGKAMMGTGEASGDNRAILAAEAAIANPLLDEVSMKGARGLLISITGGSDLTLYEVDEAASRIRQEVDEDANIILGATFDDALTGLIRVSVVATGIDHPLNAREISAAEARAAELAAQKPRVAAAPRQPEPVRYQQPVLTEAPMEQPVAYEAAPAHFQQAPMQAAPAWAPAHEAQYQPAQRPAPEAEQMHFIPPVAEQPIRAPRMPAIEDLPIPGQNQLRAQRSQPAESPDTKRRTLLDRLAAFGMSRQEELQSVVDQANRQSAPAPMASRPQAPNPVHAEYAKRPVAPPQRPAHPESQGRMIPPVRTSEEDQLEIPAFLRRQAN